MSGIRLSPKHGVNPAIPKCYFCGEDKNEIVLFGKLPNDAEAPHHQVIDKQPCEKCAGWMVQGVMLISVRVGETDLDNPYRTGIMCVVKDEFIRRVITPPELMEEVLRKRMCWIDDESWKLMGLPEGESNV